MVRLNSTPAASLAHTRTKASVAFSRKSTVCGINGVLRCLAGSLPFIFLDRCALFPWPLGPFAFKQKNMLQHIFPLESGLQITRPFSFVA
jgi:hypothetical protein